MRKNIEDELTRFEVPIHIQINCEVELENFRPTMYREIALLDDIVWNNSNIHKKESHV